MPLEWALLKNMYTLLEHCPQIIIIKCRVISQEKNNPQETNYQMLFQKTAVYIPLMSIYLEKKRDLPYGSRTIDLQGNMHARVFYPGNIMDL